MNSTQRKFKKKVTFSLGLLFIFIVMFGLVSVTGTFAQGSEANPEDAEIKEITPEEAGIAKFGLIAAAVAFGFGAIGAGIAIANVGAAAMGAIGEKPEIAGQALIFVALAEGLVVFGFITALMILGKI